MQMKKMVWWIELLAGIGLLTVGFLQDCSLSFNRPMISYVLWPSVLLAGLACLYRAAHFRRYLKSKGSWILIALCAGYLISTILSVRYGWYENIRTLILQGFLFFMVYCYPADGSAQERKKRNVWIGYYLVACAVLTVLSFVYFLMGKNEIFRPEIASVPLYYTGFFWGRLYGVYWDPNIGALMCCVSLLLAAGVFRASKHRGIKVLMAVLALLDVFYIAFSDSRTNRIALVAGVAVFAALAVERSSRKRRAAACALLAVFAAIILPFSIKMVYNNVAQASLAAKQEADSAESAETETPEVTLAGTEAVVRESDGTDVSNRRFDIWESAVDIFLEKPLFGVGHNTVLAFVEEELPDSYLINNDHMDFSSMHNTFLDVLVAQGIVGFLLYLAMGVVSIVTVGKHWRDVCRNTENRCIAFCAVIVSMVCASCFMSEIIYVCSPMSFIFWMGLGETMSGTEKNAAEGVSVCKEC